MTPNDESKFRKAKNWLKFSLPFSDVHADQVRRGLDRVQAFLPNELAAALMRTVRTEGRDVWKEFYERDLLGLGKAAKGGKLSVRGFVTSTVGARPGLANETQSSVAEFFRQITADLAERPMREDKALYLLKVAALFGSALLSVGTAINVGTVGLARTKAGRRQPWIPSMVVVLLASALARLIEHSAARLPADSKDRGMAEFLKANLEIFAFGGSLGILDVPDFVQNPSDDPSLRAVQRLISRIFHQYDDRSPTLVGMVDPEPRGAQVTR